MRNRKLYMIFAVIFAFCAYLGIAHDTGDTTHQHSTSQVLVQSTGGDNPWNQGKEPKDWWQSIKTTHGHVGPWNVLGWRIGKTSLRQFQTDWGRHELIIHCYLPKSTPYTCLVDGVAMGTGNSQGRLDLVIQEVTDKNLAFVTASRKDGIGGILVIEPDHDYMNKILNRQVEDLEKLSMECKDLPDEALFSFKWVNRSK